MVSLPFLSHSSIDLSFIICPWFIVVRSLEVIYQYLLSSALFSLRVEIPTSEAAKANAIVASDRVSTGKRVISREQRLMSPAVLRRRNRTVSETKRLRFETLSTYIFTFLSLPPLAILSATKSTQYTSSV